ncbi:hypothetical protein [Noviherbaspirillum sp.]|uniref:hypothetical protein n=1 Tax=Noviherbaspirillum sp. TaxID=1926288 RepID=UPI002FDF7CC9
MTLLWKNNDGLLRDHAYAHINIKGVNPLACPSAYFVQAISSYYFPEDLQQVSAKRDVALLHWRNISYSSLVFVSYFLLRLPKTWDSHISRDRYNMAYRSLCAEEVNCVFSLII